MDFDVTILGSNSAAPAHDRNQTSQVVNLGRNSIMIDCGEGAQIQMRRFHLKSFKISHIFISHLHADHYLGLMGMLFTYHLHKRKSPLTIFGPRGLDEIITVQLKHTQTALSYPVNFVCTQHEKWDLVLDLDGFEVFSFPLKHRLPCTGFYIKEKQRPNNLIKEKLQEHDLNLSQINTLKSGKHVLDESGDVLFSLEEFTYPPPNRRTYAYCSDTVYDPELVEIVKGVDLLYHEATFMNVEEKRATETLHSTAAQAATIAKQAQVKKLLLGHYSTRYHDLNPLLNEAKGIFDESYLSIEGETYPIH
ncbi:ribonuclease Z [Pararhodonellum marinum]|uniref:ribonuclease Z n=1 Tax=Pararhodonellum marinum TaxID=2755358 RepID=UPI00188EF242|nr:ribonuclease Z [Pararhodonellum marinum]